MPLSLRGRIPSNLVPGGSYADMHLPGMALESSPVWHRTLGVGL